MVNNEAAADLQSAAHHRNKRSNTSIMSLFKAPLCSYLRVIQGNVRRAPNDVNNSTPPPPSPNVPRQPTQRRKKNRDETGLNMKFLCAHIADCHHSP